MHILGKCLLINFLASLAQIVPGNEIINGDKAPENSMQFMVSVQKNWRHECGGFLISDDFVITAAHCAAGETQLHHVVLGSHNLKEPNAKKIKIKYMCKPENYRSVGLGNDILLVRLAEKVSLGNRVQTIPIPTWDIKLKENQTCSVAGWGRTETNRFGVDELRVVKVSIMNPEICNKQWFDLLPQNVICAGGFGTNKGFCQGDSGGPLVCDGKAVGVVSFNRNLNCNYPDVPNIYTDVSAYVPWIHRNLQETQCVP